MAQRVCWLLNWAWSVLIEAFVILSPCIGSWLWWAPPWGPRSLRPDSGSLLLSWGSLPPFSLGRLSLSEPPCRGAFCESTHGSSRGSRSSSRRGRPKKNKPNQKLIRAGEISNFLHTAPWMVNLVYSNLKASFSLDFWHLRRSTVERVFFQTSVVCLCYCFSGWNGQDTLLWQAWIF